MNAHGQPVVALDGCILIAQLMLLGAVGEPNFSTGT
jgi:hypothetical protein